MKMSLLTLYTPNIYDWARPAAAFKRDYCAIHGYGYDGREDLIDPSRPPAWSKILHIVHHMRSTESAWVFWSDADSIIMRFDIPLAKFIDTDYDIIISSDHGSPINTGQFFARNHPAVVEMLLAAYNKRQYIHHGWWEQLAVWDSLRESQLRINLVPQRNFNSFIVTEKGIGQYERGDFMAHYSSIFCDRSGMAHEQNHSNIIIRKRERFESLLNTLGLRGNGVEVGTGQGGVADCILREWQDHSLDWVYINADHSKEDILACYRKVKTGGILSGRDYGVFKSAVGEFVSSNSLNLNLTIEDDCPSWYFVKTHK